MAGISDYRRSDRCADNNIADSADNRVPKGRTGECPGAGIPAGNATGTTGPGISGSSAADTAGDRKG